MPRKAEEFDVSENKKRAPRKRAPKVVAETEETKPKRVRRTTKKVETEPEEVRRAPTTVQQTYPPKQKNLNRRHGIVIGVLLLIGIGSSAAVGFTDKGKIDVMTIIDERNKKAAERGEQLVSAEEELLPDGGLIPADPATVASSTPPIETATSTATTTPPGNIPRTQDEVAADLLSETSATSS